MKEVLDPKEIVRAQEQLDTELKAALPCLGPHRLGFRGGSKILDLHSAGRGDLYYASIFLDRADTTRRFWNAFGFYDGSSTSTQRIAVEINIPNPPSRRVAAFFARDKATGDILLLHDGKMGGGKEGVSRAGFLRHSRLLPASVESPTRNRAGVVVAKLGDPNLIHDIRAFALSVAAYKEFVDRTAKA